jgi:phosphatidate cytidylyltransferase
LLITRIGTGIILGILVTLMTLFVSSQAMAIGFGALWLVGAWEWARLAKLESGWCWTYVGAHLAIMFVLWSVRPESMLAMNGLWLALIAIAFAVVGIGRFPMTYTAPIVAIAGLFALLPPWLALVQMHSTSAGLALVAIAVIWGADVGAYFGGRAFGRHKLAPGVSPGKTWEGVAGGNVAAIGVALVALWALPLAAPPLFVAGIAVLAALASVLGDLFVSTLKRSAGVKDSGSLLPGHGGVLDRIDGLTTGLPVFALGLQLGGFLD